MEPRTAGAYVIPMRCSNLTGVGVLGRYTRVLDVVMDASYSSGLLERWMWISLYLRFPNEP